MYLGRIVEHATREQLFAKPHHPYSQSLLSAVVVPDPALQRSKKRVVLEGDIPSPSARRADAGSTPAARWPSYRCARSGSPNSSPPPTTATWRRATWSTPMVTPLTSLEERPPVLITRPESGGTLGLATAR
jgi:oligopeptide/dipeptide ABC transporter ATP-binding protein